MDFTDLFRKKEVEALKRELEELKSKTGWVNERTAEYQNLPRVKISDTQFIRDISFRFSLSFESAKNIVDYIEKKIPEEIAKGEKALVWQDLGTFYSVLRRGAWQPRVRFHKAFKARLNKKK